MTAPEKIWIDDQPYECHWYEGHIAPDTAYFVGNYTRSDLYEAAQARIKELEVELQAIRDAWALVELERDKGVENLDFTDAFISFVNIIN